MEKLIPIVHRERLYLLGKETKDCQLTENEIHNLNVTRAFTLVATLKQNGIKEGTIFSLGNEEETLLRIFICRDGINIQYKTNTGMRHVALGDRRPLEGIERGGLNSALFNSIALTYKENVVTTWLNGGFGTQFVLPERMQELEELILTKGSVGMSENDIFEGFIYDFSFYPRLLKEEELKTLTSTYIKMGGHGDSSLFYAGDAVKSDNYRIPALYTTSKGTLLAMIDARFEANNPSGGIADSAANLDSCFRRKPNCVEKRPGIFDWEDAFVSETFHMFDYPDEAGVSLFSASLIDPVLIQDHLGQGKEGCTYKGKKDRIFAMTDLFTWNGGLMNSMLPAESDGFIQIDQKSYLLLSNQNKKTVEGKNNNKYRCDFNYAVDLNEVNENGRCTIYHLNGIPSDDFVDSNDRRQDPQVTLGTKSEYETNRYLELYKNGERMYCAQKRTGKQIPVKLPYEESILQMYCTSYLYMAYSDDDGVTWESPQIISAGVKREHTDAYIFGPGRGLQIQGGVYRGRILIPVYYRIKGEYTLRTEVIYSDDGGATWQRGNTIPSDGAVSEATLIELPDHTVRIYMREASGETPSLQQATSIDGGENWCKAQAVKEFLGTHNNVQINAINYSKSIYSKKYDAYYPAIILSHPTPCKSLGHIERTHGELAIGIIRENKAFQEGDSLNQKYLIEFEYRYLVTEGQYAYSCITELPNGKIGVFYEITYNSSRVPYMEFTIEQIMGISTAPIDIVLKEENNMILLESENLYPIWDMKEEAYLYIGNKEGNDCVKIPLDHVNDEKTKWYFSHQLDEKEKTCDSYVFVSEESGFVSHTGVVLNKETVLPMKID